MTSADFENFPLVSIAILTRNRSSEVCRAIQSIYDQDYSNFEVVVVDNDSEDNTIELIKERFSKTRIIKLHSNLGVCTGRNVALANCSGDVIFTLDDDAVLKTDTLTKIMGFFANASPRIGLVCCQVFEDGRYRFPESSDFTAIFQGCGWAIRKSVLDQVGYFQDTFFLCAEESDFSLTCLSLGFRMWYLSDAVVHHMPSKARRSSGKNSFYKCRNELFIIFERYPYALIPLFVMITCLSQLSFGIRNPQTFSYILGAILTAFWQAPICLLNRRPLQFSVIRKVRFSPMYGSRLAFLAGDL